MGLTRSRNRIALSSHMDEVLRDLLPNLGVSYKATGRLRRKVASDGCRPQIGARIGHTHENGELSLFLAARHTDDALLEIIPDAIAAAWLPDPAYFAKWVNDPRLTDELHPLIALVAGHGALFRTGWWHADGGLHLELDTLSEQQALTLEAVIRAAEAIGMAASLRLWDSGRRSHVNHMPPF
jgi:hypothetical protein